MHVFAIVNPISGAGANRDAAQARAALLRERFRAANVDGEVHVTQRPHHAAELAAEAMTRGFHTVIAWGGDGTINEVGSVLAGTDAALGVVPSGSGNGFARALQLPRTPRQAIDGALTGVERLIDVGELNGRVFVNIAGVGLDAHIAERFNACEFGKRGMGPYLRIGLREAFRYCPGPVDVDLDGERFRVRPLLVAFANGREYGNRARIAPHARIDDGRLEAVIVDDRRPLARLWGSRHLLAGRPHRATGMTFRSIQHGEIRAAGPLAFHVDGEHGVAAGLVTVRIRPGYLRVRVPAEGGVFK
jgi:YegS/Rv2252/BmrU family lipid kinase